MAKLIITTIKQGICIFDTETGEVLEKKDFPYRAMGIQYVDGQYYCADRHSGLYLLDSKLNLIEEYKGFTDAYNLHDVTIVGDKAYIVDSGSNRILIYSLTERKMMDEIYLFGTINGNIHNFNSLKHKDGIFYLSMFLFNGSKASLDFTIPNKIRFANPTGAIIKIDLDNKVVEEIVCENLHQPHSIHFIDGEIHFLESMTGKLFRNDIAVKEFSKTYLRGLVSDENYIYLCKNTFRGSDSRIPVKLVVLDKQYNFVKEMDIPFEGLDEMYDLILVGESYEQ